MRKQGRITLKSRVDSDSESSLRIKIHTQNQSSPVYTLKENGGDQDCAFSIGDIRFHAFAAYSLPSICDPTVSSVSIDLSDSCLLYPRLNFVFDYEFPDIE